MIYSCLQLKCERSVGVCFCVILCFLDPDRFRLAQPKVDVYASVQNLRTANLNRTTSCCGYGAIHKDPLSAKARTS